MPRHATEFQRDLIRRFFRELGGDRSAVCDAYAAAEASGKAFRKRGDYRLNSRDYAEALIAHGHEQGWLDEPLADEAG